MHFWELRLVTHMRLFNQLMMLYLVTRLYLTLCIPTDCSPLGSSLHRIFQAKILEWVAISCSSRSYPYRNGISVSCVSCITSRFFTHLAVREALISDAQRTDILVSNCGILVAVGLCCCMWAFSSCGELGLLFIAVHGFLLVVASPVVECRLQACRLQQFQHMGPVVMARGLQSLDPVFVAHTWAQLLCGVWNIPGPRIEPMFPPLASEFLSVVPLGTLEPMSV